MDLRNPWTEETDRASRISSLFVSLVAGLAVLGAAAAPARAQSAEAEALFNDAVTLLAQNKLDEGCDMFEASNRLEARAGTLLQLGECRASQGRLASAWSAYRDALTRAKDPRKVELAREQIGKIEWKISYLTISIPAEARVGGLIIARNGKPLDPALWNRAVPIDGGEYVISGRAPGHEEWATKVTVPVENGKVTVDVPQFKALRTPAVTEPPPENEPEAVATSANEEANEAPSAFTPRRKLALATAGVAVVALAGGLWLGNEAQRLESEAALLCPDPGAACPNGVQASERSERAGSRALFANVAYGVAGAAAITAAALWLTGAPSHGERGERKARRAHIIRTERRTAVQVTSSYAGVSILGRF